MIETKRKYHLRKEVYYFVPIALLIATFISLLIINNKKMSDIKVSQTNMESSLAISDNIDYSKITNKYNDLLTNSILTRKRDNTIIYYASKFKLNINKALEIAHSYTNDYTEEYFLQNHVIGPDYIKNKLGSLPTEEAGIMYFIRDLYAWPEHYESTIEEMRVTEEATITRNIVDGKIMLNNGLTYEQFVAKTANAFGLNPKLVLAITYLETGYLKSGLFVYNNNVGGMRGYAGWMEFTTIEAGIIAHVITVKGNLDANGIDPNSETAIQELSSVYSYGYYGKIDWHWTEKVTTIFNNINDEDLQY